MELDFENLYTITLTAMRHIRDHPEIPRDLKWILQFGLLHGLFTLAYSVFAYNIILDIQTKNYSSAARNGVVSVVYFVVSTLYLIIVLKQKTLKKIMDMMKDDFKKNMTHDEKMIVTDFAKKGAEVCYQWLILTCIITSTFILKHFILEIYLYIIGDFEVLMMYPLTFPAFIEEIKMQPLIYTVIYVMTCFYMIYSSYMYVSFVPLGPMFMLHACGQLEIVKNKALGLFKNQEEEQIKAKLVDIVKHLQYIYSFVDSVKNTFRDVYEITLKGSTATLTVALYQVVWSFNHGELSVEFMAFVFGGILFSTTPCYYSDMLMEKSEEVRLAIYSCGWEARYDRQVRTTIAFILQRTLAPTSIRTVFRTVCLDALTDVFRQSYALFNLMNAAWE